jgi:hypothetical protein
MMYLFEGGNAISNAEPVNKEDVPGVIEHAKRILPSALLKNLQVNIGSAGFKEVPAGDIDLMFEAGDAVALFNTQDAKNPVLAAKNAMQTYFTAKGMEADVNGKNVSVGIPYKQQATGQNKVAQVDYMFIHDVDIVAPYHQHGPRGSYDDPAFKGEHNFIVMASIAKALNMKFAPFDAHLVYRDTNQPVPDPESGKPARTMDQVAHVLISPAASAKDLYTVKSIVAALEEHDPVNANAKLKQARDDQAKGLLTLPEAAPTPGTAAWFRKMGHQL